MFTYPHPQAVKQKWKGACVRASFVEEKINYTKIRHDSQLRLFSAQLRSRPWNESQHEVVAQRISTGHWVLRAPSNSHSRDQPLAFACRNTIIPLAEHLLYRD